MSNVISDPIAAAEAAEAQHWARVGHPEPSAWPEGGYDDLDPTRSDECDPPYILDPVQHDRCGGFGRDETLPAPVACACRCHRQSPPAVPHRLGQSRPRGPQMSTNDSATTNQPAQMVALDFNAFAKAAQIEAAAMRAVMHPREHSSGVAS